MEAFEQNTGELIITKNLTENIIEHHELQVHDLKLKITLKNKLQRRLLFNYHH